MKYIMVCDGTNYGLMAQVNECLSEGWVLYGSPFPMGTLFCQALIKEC